jgi:vacuolar-type H+-ATPase subunit I/STV1
MINVNKKDLLSFIERVESKAIKSVNDRWKKIIEEAEEKAISKYSKKIDMYQNTFNNFSTNLTNLLTDMKEDLETAYSSNWDIQNSLDKLANLKTRIKSKCSFQGEVAKLNNEWGKEIEAVRFNYKKVYIVAKGMSSTKKIVEYLEGLGFDLSTLKEDEMKYLSTDIDKSKLFVCGENK